MSELHSTNRKFERLLFKGIPEKPEPSYQRSLHADVDDRFSGKPQRKRVFSDSSKITKIASITYYLDTEESEITRVK